MKYLLTALAVALYGCGGAETSTGEPANAGPTALDADVQSKTQTCGGRIFAVYPGQGMYPPVVRELNNPRLGVQPENLDNADKANGVTWSGYVQLQANMYRERIIRAQSGKYVLETWREWQDGKTGIPEFRYMCSGGYVGDHQRKCGTYYAEIKNGEVTWRDHQFISDPTKFDCEFLTRE